MDTDNRNTVSNRRPRPTVKSRSVALTCFEDLEAQGEARPLVGVVRHEADLQGGSGGDDGGRGDVAAVAPEDVGRLGHPVTDLDEVVPGRREEGERYVYIDSSREPSKFDFYKDGRRTRFTS